MKLWRRIQGFIRLTTEGKFRAADAPAALRVGLIRACFPDEADTLTFDACEARLRDTAARVLAHYDRVVAGPAALLSPA